jgi:hypothetical protein
MSGAGVGGGRIASGSFRRLRALTKRFGFVGGESTFDELSDERYTVELIAFSAAGMLWSRCCTSDR